MIIADQGTASDCRSIQASPQVQTDSKSMDRVNAIGSRLIVRLVDSYAENEPTRVWASVLKDDHISAGFIDITYHQLANAVNHASFWLESRLGASDGWFETSAYSGPKDMSYPILALAASKLGRTVSAARGAVRQYRVYILTL